MNLQKKKVEHNMKNSSSQSNQLDVFVTGPFRNKNYKSHYVVVFGDIKKAYVLKSPFLT